MLSYLWPKLQFNCGSEAREKNKPRESPNNFPPGTIATVLYTHSTVNGPQEPFA